MNKLRRKKCQSTPQSPLMNSKKNFFYRFNEYIENKIPKQKKK